MQQFTHCIKAHKLKGRLKLSDNSLTVVMYLNAQLVIEMADYYFWYNFLAKIPFVIQILVGVGKSLKVEKKN